MRAILAVVSCLLPAVAHADNLEEAKAAFAAGKAAFERGDYDTALSQFQRANLLAPAPSLSYNIGKTYERMGRNRDAILSYERYLELAGAPQNDDEKKFQDELRGKIDALKQAPEQVSPQPAQPPPPQPHGTPQPYQPRPHYYQPYPYGYQQPQPYPYAYQQPVQTPEQRLELARKKRNSGIAAVISGGVIGVLGVGLVAGAASTTHQWTVWNETSTINASVMLAFAVPSLIVSPILLGVGGANWGKGQKDMNRIKKEMSAVPSPQPASAPSGPTAYIFGLPPVTF